MLDGRDAHRIDAMPLRILTLALLCSTQAYAQPKPELFRAELSLPDGRKAGRVEVTIEDGNVSIRTGMFGMTDVVSAPVLQGDIVLRDGTDCANPGEEADGGRHVAVFFHDVVLDEDEPAPSEVIDQPEPQRTDYEPGSSDDPTYAVTVQTLGTESTVAFLNALDSDGAPQVVTLELSPSPVTAKAQPTTLCGSIERLD